MIVIDNWEECEARRLGVARGAWGSAHPCERNFEYARAGPEAAWLYFLGAEAYFGCMLPARE